MEDIDVLIKRIARNDEKALALLFAKTKEKLHSFAASRLIERSYADDVLSEAYFKIYKKADTYRDDFNGYSWLCEIVKNTAMDFNRKLAKERHQDIDDLLCEPIEIQGFRAEEIKNALKVLNDMEYRVIRLRIWENYSFEFASSILDLKLSTLYRIYNKAIEKLEAILR